METAPARSPCSGSGVSVILQSCPFSAEAAAMGLGNQKQAGIDKKRDSGTGIVCGLMSPDL